MADTPEDVAIRLCEFVEKAQSSAGGCTPQGARVEMRRPREKLKPQIFTIYERCLEQLNEVERTQFNLMLAKMSGGIKGHVGGVVPQ